MFLKIPLLIHLFFPPIPWKIYGLELVALLPKRYTESSSRQPLKIVLLQIFSYSQDIKLAMPFSRAFLGLENLKMVTVTQILQICLRRDWVVCI